MDPLTLRHVVRQKCIEGYEWPECVTSEARRFYNPDALIDYDGLSRHLDGVPAGENIIVTFLSAEYAQIGRMWLQCLKRLPHLKFIVVAVDPETDVMLTAEGVPFVWADLSERLLALKDYRAWNGFNGKGLAITSLKYAVVRFCIDRGVGVVLSDVDALILRDPFAAFSAEADISFQRVAYFPKTLADEWGLCACGGFVRFKPSTGTSAFLERVRETHSEVVSDQVALNLALFDSELEWRPPRPAHAFDSAARHAEFARSAPLRYIGYTREPELMVEALPADTFWRHDFVPPNWAGMMVCHPNSRKLQESKLHVFGQYREHLGLNGFLNTRGGLPV